MEVETVRAHSAEEQVRLLQKGTGLVIPSLTGGRHRFFRELLEEREARADVACILPEPAFGLLFPTVEEVLASTCNSPEKPSSSWVTGKLEEFGLPPEKAGQLVKSLSGGEQMLLTLAKLSIAKDKLARLIACSPLHPLDQYRRRHWRTLSTSSLQEGRSVQMIVLDGEEEATSTKARAECMSVIERDLEWRLLIDEPVVSFSETRFPSFYPERSLKYVLPHNEVVLRSPTLVSGDNGVGKSVLCGVLANVCRLKSGRVSIKSPNGSGAARLLMQDADEQLFGKSVSEHLHWILRFDVEHKKTARSIYEKIEGRIREFVEKNLEYAGCLGDMADPSTELQAKIMLAAERIARKPALLILDEPSRKLGRDIAVRFVVEVCNQAHELKVPVLIVSHMLDWWSDVVQSHLLFRRGETSFIHIEHESQ